MVFSKTRIAISTRNSTFGVYLKKLKYLAKTHSEIEYPDDMNGDRIMATDSFTKGFREAFSIINTTLLEEINKLELYPMMGERIFALKLYMKKMDDILKEIDCE